MNTTALPLFQIDAFADNVFGGNPAAVCPLEAWLPGETLQRIAAENNLSETAFFVPEGKARYALRWMTPVAEVDLCGHATLATSWVIFHRLAPDLSEVSFSTRSGDLVVRRNGELIEMDFPALPAVEVAMPDGLAEALGREPASFWRADKNMAVFESEADVRSVSPDLRYITEMEGLGLIVTAPGEGSDCASRFFAPDVGVDEDPVTGSAHCTLVPYWSARLGKDRIHARQVSARSGDLFCEMRGDRVLIAGKAVLYLEGEIRLS